LDIVRSSDANNRALNLNGMLFYGTHCYLQMIDGPKPSVLNILAIIRADPRHRILWEMERKVAKRSFRADLPMGFIAEADVKRSSVTRSLYTRIGGQLNPDAEAAVRFLVVAGTEKYPSMVC
jgi:hypothetical protein